MMIALTSGLKALIFVLFVVLVPTVPVTIALVRAMRSRSGEAGGLTSGRAASTPFRLISVVGSAIAVVVFVALGILLLAQAVADGSDGESVAPVENGGAGTPPPDTVASAVPQQGNATAGRTVFMSSGCGDCHALRAANATGTRGPNLDEDEPDFSTVVECVTTGPGDMPSFAGRLSNSEIRNVAKFVTIGARNPDPDP